MKYSKIISAAMAVALIGTNGVFAADVKASDKAENRNCEKTGRNTGTANAEMEQDNTTDKTDIFGI